jgi:hypothetical protein
MGITVAMPLMSTIAKFARSRHGQRLAKQAMNYARSPEGKRKIDQARRQLTAYRKPKR